MRISKTVVTPFFLALSAFFLLTEGWAGEGGKTKTAPPPKTATSGHRIKFHVPGQRDSTCLIAHYYGDNQYVPRDTARFDSKGNLVFEGPKELPEGVYILIMPKNRYVEFLVGEQNQSMEFDTTDVIASMAVREGQENKVFYSYQKTMAAKGKEAASLKARQAKTKNTDSSAAIRRELEQIDKEVKAFREKLFADHAGTFAVKLFRSAMEPEVPPAPVMANNRPDSVFQFRYFKSHFFDNLDLADDRMVRTPLFHNKVEQYITKLTIQIPDSINQAADFVLGKAKSKEIFKYLVWWITNHYEKSQLMGMDAVFVHMAKNYYLSGKATWVDSATISKIRERATILDPILIGKKAPNMWLTDSTGKLITLDGFRAKATILYFWDPNCGHCQKETPKLYEFYQKNKTRGVDVFAVCIDRKPDDWKKFIREKKLNWTNVWDSFTHTDFRNTYDIYSTPVIYILDEKKKILAKRIGVETLDDFFNNYFRDLEKQPKNEKGPASPPPAGVKKPN
jgi:peroxiredoxin